MKKIFGKFGICLAILLLISFMIFSPLSKGSDEEENASLKISSREDLENLKNMGLAKGSGTPEDPYVIEGVSLTVVGKQGIFIDRTSFPLILRDITVVGTDVSHGTHGPKASALYGGIIIYGAENIILENVTIFGNYVGITIHNSQNIVIKDSSISSCFKGAEVSNAYCVSLENLVLMFNTKGVLIDSSSEVSVRECIIINSFQYGIQITGSKDVDISSNLIGFALTAITTENSIGCTVRENRIFDNSLGVFISKGSRNICISRNFFYQNKGFGVSVMSRVESVFVVENSFFYNRDSSDVYVANVSQAQDLSGIALWNTTEFGNYWHDWAGTSKDSNNDGILDGAYPIITLPGTENPPMDWRPLAQPPVVENMTKIYQIVQDYIYGCVLTNISSKTSIGDFSNTMQDSFENTLISNTLRPTIRGSSLVGIGSSLAFIFISIIIRRRFKR